jgi:hypothetical protein
MVKKILAGCLSSFRSLICSGRGQSKAPGGIAAAERFPIDYAGKL